MRTGGTSEREDRLTKLRQLRQRGIDPYPAQTDRTHSISEVLDQFEKGVSENTSFTIAGRIRAIRRHGGSSFVQLEDATGQLQAYLKQDSLGKESYDIFKEYIDPGDFLEVTGTAFTTRAGEQSIHAQHITLLTKTLRPLPEKYHGLKDVETRLRKRYLDLLANTDVRTLFRKKAVFWNTTRSFLSEQGFLEVETPVLERVPGGAEAEPFKTHYEALDQDFFLRISLELPLKRLLVGGFERVFEIGRIFRNEGISAEHLQDYTQCEFYWAYADYDELKGFVNELYVRLVRETTGGTQTHREHQTIDWTKEWRTYDFYELFTEHTGLSIEKTDDDTLRSTAKNLGAPTPASAGRGRLIEAVYKKAVRPKLIEPGFLINPPRVVEPLAKRLPSDPDRVQRLQVVAHGTELGKGFSELNDPVDQHERFSEQASLREAGDKEAQRLDTDYVEALEHGMPPAAGFGFSERLFAVLLGHPVRETVLFPPMRGVPHD